MAKKPNPKFDNGAVPVPKHASGTQMYNASERKAGAERKVRELVQKGYRINPNTSSEYYRSQVINRGTYAEGSMVSRISDKKARGKKK